MPRGARRVFSATVCSAARPPHCCVQLPEGPDAAPHKNECHPSSERDFCLESLPLENILPNTEGIAKVSFTLMPESLHQWRTCLQPLGPQPDPCSILKRKSPLNYNGSSSTLMLYGKQLYEGREGRGKDTGRKHLII